MVSFWPWKSDDNSPASFEKTLSTLSSKITNATTSLENLRQRSRRLNVLWILYSSFAYLLYSMILVLVVGWKNWGLIEISAVIGGPILIYLIRLGLVIYYNYRISKSQAHLDDLQRQRDAKIEQLKSATKYNTTQELLKKYGGVSSPKSKPLEVPERRSSPNQNTSGTHKGGRTGILPPPTANISGKAGQVSLSSTLQKSSAESQKPLGQPNPPSAASTASSLQQENAEFAPNAFPSTPQYIQPSEGPKWYDRLMDVLLGEDESLPRNRIALICNQCRLVNGQAPPGVKGLESLGKWRCGGCGAMNGEEVEVKKIVANINEEKISQKISMQDESRRTVKHGTDDWDNPKVSEDEQSDVTQYSEVSSNDNGAALADAEKPKLLSSEGAPLPKRRVGRPRLSKNQAD